MASTPGGLTVTIDGGPFTLQPYDDDTTYHCTKTGPYAEGEFARLGGALTVTVSGIPAGSMNVFVTIGTFDTSQVGFGGPPTGIFYDYEGTWVNDHPDEPQPDPFVAPSTFTFTVPASAAFECSDGKDGVLPVDVQLIDQSQNISDELATSVPLTSVD